jgi:arylsulfatase A
MARHPVPKPSYPLVQEIQPGHRNLDQVTHKARTVCDDPKLMFSMTSRGGDFMERSVKAGKPFFLQLSHYAPHGPYQSRPETLKKYETIPVFEQIADPKKRHWTKVYYAMMEDLDAAVGQLLDKIKALGIEKTTYVVFGSDNGHVQFNESHTHLLRGNKWWLWEMGIRVPLIVSGPGIAAGSQSSVNVVGYDFLPTFAELAGAKQQLPEEVDGVSFAPLLFGRPLEDEDVERPIFFHYPHYTASAPCSAIVQGEMKLLYFYEWPEEHYLCNLAQDIGESKNLAKSESQRAAQMYKTMMEKLKEVGAYFPQANPNATPKAKSYRPDDPDARALEGDY